MQNLNRLAGSFEQMEKRFLERLTEIDKRLAEADLRTEIKVKLSIREYLERADSLGEIRPDGNPAANLPSRLPQRR